jgi:hypothetical protein
VGGNGFRVRVPVASGLGLAERGGDHGGVVPLVGFGVFPDEAGFAVAVQDVGGEPVRVRGLDARGREDLADDRGAVGLVLGQGLAGPVPGHQGAAAAEAEALAVVRLGAAVPGVQSGRGVLGLDAVPEPVREGEQGSTRTWAWNRSMWSSYRRAFATASWSSGSIMLGSGA